jgi:hypothetical protein
MDESDKLFIDEMNDCTCEVIISYLQFMQKCLLVQSFSFMLDLTGNLDSGLL